MTDAEAIEILEALATDGSIDDNVREAVLEAISALEYRDSLN